MVIIDAQHFYAACVLQDGVVIRSAPVLKYMVGWSLPRVEEYCNYKGWLIV